MFDPPLQIGAIQTVLNRAGPGRRCIGIGIAVAGAVFCYVLAGPIAAVAQNAAAPTSSMPDFSGLWARNDPNMSFMPPPEEYHPPVREHPDYVHVNPGDDQTGMRVPDATDPLLKPWAQAHLADVAARAIRGDVVLPAHSLCWPSGVPGSLRLRENVQFLQEEDQVTIIYQRDHQVRRIYLNQPHAENIEPSWYGASVGHYESGDTLVVDTVGLDDRSAVDWIYTPHTKNIHVVEHYRLIDENTIEVLFIVEDSETFKAPWAAIVHYRRQGPGVRIAEVVCAENNRDAAGGLYPIPVAERTDF